jgi:hypothetical protein
MHFGTKNYLKSTCNHTAKHALTQAGTLEIPIFSDCEVIFMLSPCIVKVYHSGIGEQLQIYLE